MALGVIMPPDTYFRALTDGEGEALQLKGQYQAARASMSFFKKG